MPITLRELKKIEESGNYYKESASDYYERNKETIDRFKVEAGKVSYDLPQEVLIDIKINNILGKEENRNYMEVYEKHIKCEPNPVEREFFAFFFGYNGNMLIISFILLVALGLPLILKLFKQATRKID